MRGAGVLVVYSPCPSPLYPPRKQLLAAVVVVGCFVNGGHGVAWHPLRCPPHPLHPPVPSHTCTSQIAPLSTPQAMAHGSGCRCFCGWVLHHPLLPSLCRPPPLPVAPRSHPVSSCLQWSFGVLHWWTWGLSSVSSVVGVGTGWHLLFSSFPCHRLPVDLAVPPIPTPRAGAHKAGAGGGHGRVVLASLFSFSLPPISPPPHCLPGIPSSPSTPQAGVIIPPLLSSSSPFPVISHHTGLSPSLHPPPTP
jgi:hypothetical protein